MDAELSLGELDSYPLKRASSICKATGGGRWEPKPIPEYAAKRIPGRKPTYELELEREEEERRLRRLNPVIKDGGQSAPACALFATADVDGSFDRLPAPLPPRDRATLSRRSLHPVHLLTRSTRSSVVQATLSIALNGSLCLVWLSATVCVCPSMLCTIIIPGPLRACRYALLCDFYCRYTCLVVTLTPLFIPCHLFAPSSTTPSLPTFPSAIPLS